MAWMIKTQICQALLKNSKHTAHAAEPTKTGKLCFKATTATEYAISWLKWVIRRKTSNYNNPNNPQARDFSYEKTRWLTRHPQKHQTQKTNPNLLPKMRQPKNRPIKQPRGLVNSKTILLRRMWLPWHNCYGT